MSLQIKRFLVVRALIVWNLSIEHQRISWGKRNTKHLNQGKHNGHTY